MVSNELMSADGRHPVILPSPDTRRSEMKTRFVWIAALALTAAGIFTVRAQERVEIFDAHLHYNQEPRPFYSLDQVRDVFRHCRHCRN